MLLGAAVVLLAGVAVGGLVAREALAMRRDLLRAQAEFDQAVAVTDPVLADFGSFRQTSAALDASAVHLSAADDALASAARRRGRLAPLLAIGSLLPGWTRGLGDVEPLIGAGRELARAGIELSEGFAEMTARLDATRGGEEPSGRRLVSGLTAAEPAFNRALAALEDARAHRDSVDTERFGGPLSAANNALATFDRRYQPLHENAELVARLPAAVRSVLGMDGPRTYAVLGQNSTELRPTGGFIGSLGLVTIENGELTAQDYRGVYLLEDRQRGCLLPRRRHAARGRLGHPRRELVAGLPHVGTHARGDAEAPSRHPRRRRARLHDVRGRRPARCPGAAAGAGHRPAGDGRRLVRAGGEPDLRRSAGRAGGAGCGAEQG
jgi:hypothetical protein